MTQFQGYANAYPTSIGTDPKGGKAKAMPAGFDWTVQQSYTLDFQNQIQRQYIDQIQGVYIDNKDAGGDITILCAASMQSITIKAGQQAFLPIINADPYKFTISNSAATGSSMVYFLNTPTYACTWAAK